MATGESDRILLARISGTAGRLARVRDWPPETDAAAVTELHELAGGRPDLLAEVAVMCAAFSGQRVDY